MPVLTIAEAEDLVARTLRRCRTGEANAKSVARALVAAEADGLKGHGLSRVPTYAAQVKVGKVDGFALLFTNPPAAIAPWGGSKGLFGTNPIAFACPLPDAPPLVVDLSL